MKDLQKMMLKVKNVINLILVFFITSCTLNKIASNNNFKSEEYTLEKHKSSYKLTTQIIFKTFDFENKQERIPATLVINKVLVNNSEILNLWSGKHTLKALFIGKKTIDINNLIVKKGDSIVINAYLKDSTEPLY